MISLYQIRTVLLHSERTIYIYALSYIFLPLWWDTLRIYVGPLSEITCWWYKFFKNFITTAVLLGFNFIILVRVCNNMSQDGRTDLYKKSLPRTIKQEPLKVHSKMSNFEKFVFWTQAKKILNYGDLGHLLYGLLL